MRRLLAAPIQIVVFGGAKMRRLTQLSTAAVIWVDLYNKIRLIQSHNPTGERLGVRRLGHRFIVYDGQKSNDGLPSVMNANTICACKLVRKCNDKDICDVFKDHFTTRKHGMGTRNANNSLKVTKIRTDYACK